MVLELDLVELQNIAAGCHRGLRRALRGCERRHGFFHARLRSDQIGEAVVPEAPDIEKRRRVLLLVHQALRHLNHAVDMVVVHVTEHGEVDCQLRLVASELFQTRPQIVVPRPRRSTVDHPKPLLPTVLIVQQQSVPISCVERFEPDHRPLPYTDWSARRMSSMPAPWKLVSRPRSVADLHRISLIMAGRPTSSRCRAISNAAAPLTWGAAMLVPSMRLDPLGIGAVIFSPGATKSGLRRPSPVGPRLEK